VYVFNWTLTSGAATTVGTPSVTSSVSQFKVKLMGDAIAVPAPDNKFKIGPGNALFDLSAVVDGEASSVQAKNSTSIYMQFVNAGVAGCPSQATNCLLTASFDIEYVDPDERTWVLDIDGPGIWAAGLVSPAHSVKEAESGGCGCRSGTTTGAGSLFLLGILGIAGRRRRR
jgi:MYXO-CTERM domain-containing protein